MKKYYCYILSNKNRTVLYVGYTDNIKRRVLQHKQGNGALFTKKYNVADLIFYEEYDNSKEARDRERQLKNWHKEWKLNLIKVSNPSLNSINII
ncbi:GIY-YIG nuclease family protein [Winogradskyella endarachnes]|uniref:Excinuclease ABC subunit C n=1 Tax=Winogradskyella endarachnes TaxID=2681965 RepID=A0A6L6U4T6_9FLAO|nr:GIY-YIG nuclease family protein [Winogradskyella endarachnes]MUU77145.1 excinuclease ABC subunit C [Winogradskyella endarachnes]